MTGNAILDFGVVLPLSTMITLIQGLLSRKSDPDSDNPAYWTLILGSLEAGNLEHAIAHITRPALSL